MSRMTPRAALYIVASPRPGVGKTLTARLLMEFFRASGRPLVGYDLNPREPLLAARFPPLVWTIDIAQTRGQMELFDRLIADDSTTKVVDLGYNAFEQFFKVAREIGFAQEARQRSIEPIVLFVTDPAPSTARAYGELLRRAPQFTFVPLHNEAVSVMFTQDDFPLTRECGFIRIPRLSPLIRGVLDRPSVSFAPRRNGRSAPTEVDDWVRTIFNEFRQLELKLLMGKLALSLAGAGRAPQPRRTR
ncbi:MAG TPA: hypothetical protein VGJ20_39890 [Xanthobacteraceae bacterium]